MKKFFGALAISIVLLTGAVSSSYALDKALEECMSYCTKYITSGLDNYAACLDGCLHGAGLNSN